MKKAIKNIAMISGIALLMLFFLATMLVSNPHKRLNKNVTLYRKDKIPYGSFVCYELLRKRFPHANFNDVYDPLHIQLNKIKGNHNLYIILTPRFILPQNDINALLNFAARGNEVLIGASIWDDKLSDTLHFINNIATIAFGEFILEDTSHVQLVNAHLDTAKYFYTGRPLIASFAKVDSSHSQVLGLSDSGDADFIRVNVGKGALLLQANPLVFSNFFLLQYSNFNYADAAFSYLPDNAKNIFWDDYYYRHFQSGNSFSPFEIFFKYPSLQYVFWLSLLLALLYILFEMKRRQRIIPVQAPPVNTSVEFVKTLGDLYLNKKDNRQIADKQFSYLLEYIRSRFFLSTHILDKQFMEQLSGKSNIPFEEIEMLFNNLKEAKDNFDLTDQQLLQLNFLVENFYKKTI